jgi:hypothetical protein
MRRFAQFRIAAIMFCALLAFFGFAPVDAAGQSSAEAAAQEPARAIQELRLKDGSRLYGYVEEAAPDKIVFTTLTDARLEVQRAQIESLAPARGRLVNGAFLPADPNPTRLFFAPTGRALARGEGYFGVYEFVLPFLQVGLTDRISIGLGTPFFFGGGSGHPFWVTPKAQVYEHGPSRTAVGIIHFMNVGDGNFGIAYAVTTYGGLDDAVTGGIGYAYARYSTSSHATVIGMIGGEHRLSRRLKFITENYVWRDGGIISGGVRFLGERLSADVGIFAPIVGDTTVAAPVVNFVWKF